VFVSLAGRIDRPPGYRGFTPRHSPSADAGNGRDPSLCSGVCWTVDPASLRYTNVNSLVSPCVDRSPPVRGDRHMTLLD
jgi:hypothetical protein